MPRRTGLHEKFADLAVHGRVLVDVVELVQSRLGLLELRLGLLLLCGHLLGRLLKVLQFFEFLLCFWRQITLHTEFHVTRTEKDQYSPRTACSHRPNSRRRCPISAYTVQIDGEVSSTHR